MFLCFILFFIGLFILFFPKLVWVLAEMWKSSDATEPSDIYIKITRFGGALCTLIGLAGIILLAIL